MSEYVPGIYTMHTRFCTFGVDLYAQSVIINKIPASELSQKFVKSVQYCWLVRIMVRQMTGRGGGGEMSGYIQI